jgi:Zn-dependent M16 (insulinase) family peptidase
MRKINTADVFKMARLMKSAKLTESIKRAYTAGKEKDANMEEVGMNAIMDIMGSCCDTGTEKSFYELLAGISEKAENEVRDQSLETTIADIKRICTENNIVNFLKSASSMSLK